MSDYEIIIARSARKELESLDEKSLNRIFPKIESLSGNPRPSGCKKLVGSKFLWRIRVGDYRVIYAIHDDRNIVDIIAVRHRKDIYE
jgi:mRNA interferase RelE/StbE